MEFRCIFILVGIIALSGCGSGTTSSTSTTKPPTEPGYPSTPPVPITWSPSTIPLPAPPAQVPPPAGSNDFPLSISKPTDGATVTSPATVVASATPKNPIFFMRVSVDQLAVCVTFTNSFNTQIRMNPGQHQLEALP